MNFIIIHNLLSLLILENSSNLPFQAPYGIINIYFRKLPFTNLSFFLNYLHNSLHFLWCCVNHGLPRSYFFRFIFIDIGSYRNHFLSTSYKLIINYHFFRYTGTFSLFRTWDFNCCTSNFKDKTILKWYTILVILNTSYKLSRNMYLWQHNLNNTF